MRGTHTSDDHLRQAEGIIPAYAGNTQNLNVYHLVPEDHPRVCGEHPIAHIPRYVTQGSSPRMRGTPICAVHVDNLTGIIPAYAGNTRTTMRESLRKRDHPRVCGEHVEILFLRLSVPGSSPRMRGTPRTPRTRPAGGGIIPAYAGNTLVSFFVS